LPTDGNEPLWRRCEREWAAWLSAHGWLVTQFCDATGNMSGTQAPMSLSPGGVPLVAPDLQAVKAGQLTWWEVKTRVRPETDPLTGLRYHWIPFDRFKDYLKVSQASQTPLMVALYERSNRDDGGRWLTISLDAIYHHGFKATIQDTNGEELKVIQWPVDEMEIANGPVVNATEPEWPVTNVEAGREPTPSSDLEPYEAGLRSGGGELVPRKALPEVGEAVDKSSPSWRVLEAEPESSLEVLCRKLGIPQSPRYSVLRVGGGDVTGILELLHYGIRVFLVSDTEQDWAAQSTELAAFCAARLLEYVAVDDLGGISQYWLIDGKDTGKRPATLDDVLARADAVGTLNYLQYRIVHAAPNADVLATAGAGTGKTETMAERLVFLLCNVDIGDGEPGRPPQYLSLDEIALITFTREAAREMRERIARTIILRQRLCHRCVLPTIAWLMQLGRAEVSTIHMFAKRQLQTLGGAIGLSSGFKVSQQTMAFRDLAYEELSSHLGSGADELLFGGRPPAHEWLKHIETIWQTLENNGVPLIQFMESAHHTHHVGIDWAGEHVSGMGKKAADATYRTIEGIREKFAEHCIANQVVPTNQLVPGAMSALNESGGVTGNRLKFLFVDEFQDTDPLQIQYLVSMRKELGLRLFVVGDVKQGVYRFRGAFGNAFRELVQALNNAGLDAPVSFPLTRNFRSDGRLLDSLHPLFSAWGKRGLLAYGQRDKLRARREVVGQGRGIAFASVHTGDDTYVSEAADWVMGKQDGSRDPAASIAIICRQNSQAIKIQREVRERGGHCQLFVGGSFFRCPAARELSILLSALIDPSDNSALLQLCETRWSGKLLAGLSVSPDPSIDAGLWSASIDQPISWKDRFGSLASGDRFKIDDLELMRNRIKSLAGLVERMPAMALVVLCTGKLVPENCSELGSDDLQERKRYSRCLTHLITLLDEQFADSAVTMYGIHEWLKLQVQTNYSEDEPQEEGMFTGETWAVTVHKSKGLEFDDVLVPHTWLGFEPPEHVPTITAIQSNQENRKRLLWQWRSVTPPWTNASDADAGIWEEDEKETVMEETRLLYVAMTRARKTLTVFLPGYQLQRKSWAWLISEARANG